MKPHNEARLDRFCKPVSSLLDTVGKSFSRCFRQKGTSAVTPRNAALVERELSMRAFALWERAGHPDGREWDYWDQAETEFAAESRPPCHRTNFHPLKRSPPRRLNP